LRVVLNELRPRLAQAAMCARTARQIMAGPLVQRRAYEMVQWDCSHATFGRERHLEKKRPWGSLLFHGLKARCSSALQLGSGPFHIIVPPTSRPALSPHLRRARVYQYVPQRKHRRHVRVVEARWDTSPPSCAFGPLLAPKSQQRAFYLSGDARHPRALTVQLFSLFCSIPAADI
jgi:hypothetical protein